MEHLRQLEVDNKRRATREAAGEDEDATVCSKNVRAAAAFSTTADAGRPKKRRRRTKRVESDSDSEESSATPARLDEAEWHKIELCHVVFGSQTGAARVETYRNLILTWPGYRESMFAVDDLSRATICLSSETAVWQTLCNLLDARTYWKTWTATWLK